MTQHIPTSRRFLEQILDALKSSRTSLIENKPPGWQLTYNNCQTAVKELSNVLNQHGEIKLPVAWLATYVSKDGELQHYTTTHYDLAMENDMCSDPRPLYL